MTILLKNKAPYLLSCVVLSSAVLLSAGCTNESADGAVEQAENTPSSLLEKTAAAATAVVDDAKNAVEETTAAVSAAVAETKTAVTETTDKATAVVSDVKDAIVEKTEAVKQAVVTEKKASAPAADGAKLYASCSGCHGSRAEGGVGPNLNAQTASGVANKLNRYKAGEQIGPMSGMMTPIAKGLSDAEIKAVAGYVVTLK